MKKIFLIMAACAMAISTGTAQPKPQTAALNARIEVDASLAELNPEITTFQNGDKITVNGKAYTLKVNKKGRAL